MPGRAYFRRMVIATHGTACDYDAPGCTKGPDIVS
jgi:hypothetical protein